MQTTWITSIALLASATAGDGLRLRPPRRRPVQVRRVTIHGGFRPAELHVEAGRPIRLMVRRETTSACSEYVVIPALGRSVMLPPFEDVSIDLPPMRSGVHLLTCKANLFSALLLVGEAQPLHEPQGIEGRQG